MPRIVAVAEQAQTGRLAPPLPWGRDGASEDHEPENVDTTEYFRGYEESKIRGPVMVRPLLI